MNLTQQKVAEPSPTHLFSMPPQNAEAWFALSNTHSACGNINEAGDCCRHALALQPAHFEANITLGNILCIQGKHADAISFYKRAIGINPLHAVVHCNLGNAHSFLGKDNDAIEYYQKAIKLDPNLFIAFYNLGNLRMRQGFYDKAANNFGRAVILQPTQDLLNHIKRQGVIMIKNDGLEPAGRLFSRLCQTFPEDVQSWLHFSSINAKLGKLEEAGANCRRVLAIDPRNDRALVVLGNVCFNRRDLEDALCHYEQALTINPGNITALNNFGNACQTDFQANKYFEFYRSAINRIEEPDEARAVFGRTLLKFPPKTYAPWLDEELQVCFATSDFDDKYLSRAVSQLLRLKYDFHKPEYKETGIFEKIGRQLAADKLFIFFLERTVSLDPDIEIFLIRLRRELLAGFYDGNGVGATALRLMIALAHQAFNNEYVFSLDDKEEQRINALRRSIEERISAIHRPDRDLECMLAAFAMYENLNSLDDRGFLGSQAARCWSPNVATLVEKSILDPLEEAEIKQGIPVIGSVEDITSRLVQSQYEEHPYPKWLSVHKDRSRSLKLIIRQLFPDFSPPAFLDGPVRILVAGCGTGKHPIQTAAYDNVEITAVDISKRSLAYAIRMARKYGVSNVRFMHGDILQLAELDMRFHVIECVGVLHHMEDPLTGWRILSGLLEDDGLMSIGLYSELGRRPVSAAREIIGKEGLAPDRENIRRFRQRIWQSLPGDTIYGLRHFSDFYSTSECRDLLFHFTEHQFTLPRLRNAIHDLNLNFLGFTFDDLKASRLFRERFPQDEEMKNLAFWQQHEERHPNTFSGMYKFWCQKSARNDTACLRGQE